MRKLHIPCLGLLAFALAQPAQAQSEKTYDRADFTVTAEREIENDTLIAIVFAEFEDNDQSNAANNVNEAIEWAAGRARQIAGVELQTLRYTTRPVYAPNSRRITGWIARQSLRLESRDAEALSALLGELQTRVAIESMTQELSRKARAAVEDELIAEALEKFQRRAELVAAEMGRDGYRLMFVDINSGGAVPVAQSRGVAFAFSADAEITAPGIEAGIQLLSVRVNGAIELNAE
jgi:predicted secreted protein